nr:MAG TPA: hypothetical protein [Bacteriophage sp.]
MAKNFHLHQSFLLQSLIQNRKILLRKSRCCHYNRQALQVRQKNFL